MVEWCIHSLDLASLVPLSLPSSSIPGLWHHLRLLVRFLLQTWAHRPSCYLKCKDEKFTINKTGCLISFSLQTVSLGLVLNISLVFIAWLRYSVFWFYRYCFTTCVVFYLYNHFVLWAGGFTLCFVEPCSWSDLSVTQTPAAFLLMNTILPPIQESHTGA